MKNVGTIDRAARAVTFGLDNPLATRFWTAVKTGTSKDMRDNWCIGYTSRYTVGVWVGNASGAPMWDVSGTSGAAQRMCARARSTPQPAQHPSRCAGFVKGFIGLHGRQRCARVGQRSTTYER